MSEQTEGDQIYRITQSLVKAKEDNAKLIADLKKCNSEKLALAELVMELEHQLEQKNKGA